MILRLLHVSFLWQPASFPSFLLWIRLSLCRSRQPIHWLLLSAGIKRFASMPGCCAIFFFFNFLSSPVSIWKIQKSKTWKYNMTGETAQRIRKLEVRRLKCWFPSSCQVTCKCLKVFTHEIEIHMYIFKKRERVPNTSGSWYWPWNLHEYQKYLSFFLHLSLWSSFFSPL